MATNYTHTANITVWIQCEPSLKVDWRTKAVMVMTLETSMGRDTEWEGGDYIYLASVSLCEVSQGAQQCFLFISPSLWTARVAIHHTDNCPQQWVDGTWRGLRENWEGGAADNFETTVCDVCMQCDNDMSFWCMHLICNTESRVSLEERQAYFLFYAFGFTLIL